MTISSSLNAGVQGLAVNSTRLGTIANNIANADTYGYKRAETDFVSLVIEGNSSSFAAGGVRVLTSREVSAQGSLITTGNATDLAIAGPGFLPVTEEGAINDTNRDLLLTTTGSFEQDQNGYLKTPGGLVLLGWRAGPDGNIGAVTRQGVADLEPVRVNTSQFQSSPTTLINMGVNLPADQTVAGAAGTVYDMPVDYIDNLGRNQTMTAIFTPVVPATGASNEWNVEFLDNSSGTPVSVGTFNITFQDNPANGGSVDTVTTTGGGLVYDPATGRINVNLPSGPVDVFVGQSGDISGLVQVAANFTPANLDFDGVSVGELEGIEINSSGLLQAVYNTGFRQTLYQIPVAAVQNANGLIAENNQAFRLSQDSGGMYLWDAGTGPVGETVGFSLMESTVDIASELTALIETQRAYSSNARIIQTVDEILQETTNIIR
ncbi:flagellar hook protein FlgE [Parvularcula marina]|uniref:Flagellar hook protein FlgE n=1 Tax=Parvularcula marina TaxID=2292771 RepID=A0A371RH09_9PROT|nr:flagellar hook-basal body complex protein [Parvularcula marina]RFB04747.1 flagellar hook-basal body complex protein [Parvularcula marina]